MQPNPYNQDDSSEELCRHILASVRADQDEIEAAANSPFLFQRIRNQIAAESSLTPQKAVTNNRNLFSALSNLFQWRWEWALPVTALLLVGFVMLATKSKSATNQLEVVTIASPSATPEQIAPGNQETGSSEINPSGDRIIDPAPQKNIVTKASYHPSVKRSPNRISRSTVIKAGLTEEVTDFLPLTYVAEATESDSGHIVRVEVPRTMMASMGVPTNQERHAEFVKADVIIGDDGLARAIRFVQ